MKALRLSIGSIMNNRKKEHQFCLALSNKQKLHSPSYHSALRRLRRHRRGGGRGGGGGATGIREGQVRGGEAAAHAGGAKGD